MPALTALCLNIISYSSMNKLDPSLVDKVIQVESKHNPSLIGDDGKSIGLMQVQLPTARDMGFKGKKEDLLNTEINLMLGTKYLKYLITRYNGNTKLALLAYNKGMGVADRYKTNKTWNAKYVNDVLGKTTTICKTQ